MNEEEEARAGELRAVRAAMERRSGLRAEDFQIGDRVRLLPWAQPAARGHSGIVVGFERRSKRGKPRGSVLVALDQLPPVDAPVAVPPTLLERELQP